jgi:phosphatidylserine decarboxylase
MNVFNCHVNRSPVEGVVTKLAYRPGKYVNASLDKASEDNERQSVRIRTEDGREFGCVQIAGLVARRILCDLTLDQRLRAGERIGMIRFGSRVDIYLPKGVAPMAVPGQTTVAGETVLADMTRDEGAWKGEIR